MTSNRTIVEEHRRHVVAMGGAFGYDTPASKRFLRYILKLTGKSKPRVLFLGTASGDKDYGPLWLHRQLSGINCYRTELPFFDPVPTNLQEFVFQHDAIFVGGGNSRSMLGVWQAWDFGPMLKAAWEHGIVLSGASAGAMCWFEQPISASSTAGEVYPLTGLGIVAGSCSPHYDSDTARRPGYEKLMQDGLVVSGYGIDECAALHVIGRRQVESLAGQAGSACYSVRKYEQFVIEEKLPTRLLTR